MILNRMSKLYKMGISVHGCGQQGKIRFSTLPSIVGVDYHGYFAQLGECCVVCGQNLWYVLVQPLMESALPHPERTFTRSVD